MVAQVNPRSETSVSQLYLTCTLAGSRFLIPIGRVREVEAAGAITPVPMTPSWLRGIINLRGAIVELVDLANFLELTPVPGLASEALICAAGASGRDDETLIALAVEEVSAIQQIADDAIVPLPESETTSLTAYLHGFYRLASNEGGGDALVGMLDLEQIITALVADQSRSPHDFQAGK